MGHTVRILVALALPLWLTGCLLIPGKFTADMTVHRNAEFSFAYRGEIYLLGLGQLAKMGQAMDEEDEGFLPSPCYDESDQSEKLPALLNAVTHVQREWDDAPFERECTQAELDQQRDDWNAERAEQKEKEARELELGIALLGGIDPQSPEAIDEFVERLLRQKGWNSVVHKGNGVFDVDYAITGTLAQDFSFPTIERTPGLSPFIVAIARDNDAARIDAPGFVVAPMTGSIGGMGGLLSMIGTLAAEGKGKNSDFAMGAPKLDGVFTIRTDGEVLTNNTEDGATTIGDQRVLTWRITSHTDRAPQAMIGFDKR